MKHEDGNAFHYYEKTDFEPMLAEHNAAKAAQEDQFGRGGRNKASKKKPGEEEGKSSHGDDDDDDNDDSRQS